MTKPSITIDADTLSLIIAVCAILISAASFYATYLQAQSAERQVKAMTMPLLRFTHGNYDEETGKQIITFGLKNAGVGPAVLKNVAFVYHGHVYSEPSGFFRACCLDEATSYRDRISEINSEGTLIPEGSIVTSPLDGVIIPGQSEYDFFGLGLAPVSEALWRKINTERWNLSVSVCYCSMLDDCFASKGDSVTAVASCLTSQASDTSP